MKLHIFNPENDLALADGGFSYCPPPAAMRIANELASLPLWYAGEDSVVALPEEHTAYRNAMATMFALPALYTPSMRQSINSFAPWGWSAQMRHRLFKAMGFDKTILPTDAQIERMRDLSSRVMTIGILTALRDAGIDTPPLPQYMTNLDAVIAFVNSNERCVVKAPWSGSGKGIMWGLGKAEKPLVHFCKGVIKRQGGVVCEHFLNAKLEFAMEFYAGGDSVEFAGYSLFTAENGAYVGNMLASDSVIEDHLSQYIPLEILTVVKEYLCIEMQRLLSGSGYKGYFGIDMMIYDNGDDYRLNPCMEVNMRMNMGVVSRIFFDRFVSPESKGVYRVAFFKQQGEAWRFHCEMQAKHSLRVENGRILRGYIALSPVTHENRYIAYATIDE